MKWRLIESKQNTDLKYLNHFTLTYEVEGDDGRIKRYPYHLASRFDIDHLRAKTGDYTRPDGVIIALIKEGESGIEVLLTSQFRPAVGRYMTSFPAGLLDPEDKDYLEAAKREAEEESGWIIDEIETLVPGCPTSSGLTDEFDAIVLGKVVGQGKKQLEDFEDIASRFVPLSDVKAMMDDPAYCFPMMTRLILLYLLERFSHA
ncbi:MAG: NUDIX hydrolase [Bacilli bacterium]|nr:NUDIX hydrolase [Bacilli bacterium]